MPQGGASNEYPQHMFLSRNKKILPDTQSYLDLWSLTYKVVAVLVHHNLFITLLLGSTA